MKKLTPMMKQYFEIKEQYQDCILFFRLGDFYEMFFDDALTASKELEITLTGRECGQKEKAPMCGVPHHSAENYISKLITKGYKVAICEQTEDASAAKGIVKRDVVKVITPGTVISPNMLKEKENNYLLSVYVDENACGFVFTDISTGELKGAQISQSHFVSKLVNEIAKTKPSEVIINQDLYNNQLIEDIRYVSDAFVNTIDDWYFKEAYCSEQIFNHFNIKALKGLGLDDKPQMVKALGALLGYLGETQKNTLSHLNNLQIYNVSNHMSMDKSTFNNLELVETVAEKRVQGSLLGVLDKTNTAMGGRRLKQWIKEPLNTLNEIQQRLDAVEALMDEALIRNNFKECLKQVYDLERLCGRIACGTANARDLIALKNSLSTLPDVKCYLEVLDAELLNNLQDHIDPLDEITDKISHAIVEDPPYTIKEGGLIKEGFHDELDVLKHSISDGKLWIANLENSERARTGIKSLKVGFNKVFGYYIEVTKSYYDMVPEEYIRKQTLANCERFITPELKEVESKVLNAENKINEMEYGIFLQLRNHIQTYSDKIQQTAQAISQLDVLISFAEISNNLNYVKPKLNNSNTIHIINGRHPVVELSIKNGMFVANNTYINDDDSSFLLITGPNMAGKSTYMRQTAMIVLMAQIGCFVPAEEAEIGVVDTIYTRIGASDNLAQGQSTFLVEMSELAYILNSATEKSLIILDEIGRGTSTYDGLSIAWAVVEYLCNKDRRIKTLFATHYHELTQLENIIPGVKNLNVDVKEDNDDIIFLHKIIDGCANQSYGIQVAKLAGIPSELLVNADKKLLELEKKSSQVDLNKNKVKSLQEDQLQLSLFNKNDSMITQKLKEINLLNTTPMQAINILEELIKQAQ
ncbi:MAG: DNA mismatch repair protein MutS [Clostridia bacterium]|nr:DNA mismatch repair protein MutS [Clostridia bacterium]